MKKLEVVRVYEMIYHNQEEKYQKDHGSKCRVKGYHNIDIMLEDSVESLNVTYGEYAHISIPKSNMRDIEFSDRKVPFHDILNGDISIQKLEYLDQINEYYYPMSTNETYVTLNTIFPLFDSNIKDAIKSVTLAPGENKVCYATLKWLPISFKLVDDKVAGYIRVIRCDDGNLRVITMDKCDDADMYIVIQVTPNTGLINLFSMKHDENYPYLLQDRLLSVGSERVFRHSIFEDAPLISNDMECIHINHFLGGEFIYIPTVRHPFDYDISGPVIYRDEYEDSPILKADRTRFNRKVLKGDVEDFHEMAEHLKNEIGDNCTWFPGKK